MSSQLNNPFSINGVISTNKTVLQNLNDLCTATSSFLTYDVGQGKWCVVINRPGTSVASFTDNNIIGNINISETGVSELYNAVSVEFPHADLRDQKDYVDLKVADTELFANEAPNVLTVTTDVINHPIQASLIGSIELKQSRVSKVIEFRTDFSKLGLKAGDLIDITSDMYGFTNKIFRIVKLEEDDSDGIKLSITALEYNSDVYSSDGLTRTEKSKATGIILSSQNAEIQKSNDIDMSGTMVRLLAANAAAGLLSTLFKRLFTNGKLNGKLGPNTTDGESIDKILGGTKRPDFETMDAPEAVCEGGTIVINMSHNCTSCLTNIPPLDYPYTITGVSSADIGVPLTGKVTVTDGSGSISIPVKTDAVTEGIEDLTFTCGGMTKVIKIVDPSHYDYTVAVSGDSSFTEGETKTYTITTTNVDDGTFIPYEISGDTSRITSPLSGIVEITGNSGSLTVETSADGQYTGPMSIVITMDPLITDPCESTGPNRIKGVTINDSSPNPGPTTNCNLVQIPIFWCPKYNSSGQVVGLTPTAYAMVPAAYSGGPTLSVPTAVSVTPGSPSTITVTSSQTIDNTNNKSGMSFNVITSFNSIPVNGVASGTTSTVRGILV